MRLLLDPRLHVSEVADRCGFCNPAYFASVFKKYMHCTPRAYRQPAAALGNTPAPPPACDPANQSPRLTSAACAGPVLGEAPPPPTSAPIPLVPGRMP